MHRHVEGMGKAEKRYRWELSSGWAVGVSRGTLGMVRMSDWSSSWGRG